MSHENVEIVRHGFLQPGPMVDSARVSPDAEFDFTDVYPDQPVLRGAGAMRRFRDGGPWGASIHFEPRRFFDVDDERVLVFVDATSTGQTSGAAVESRIAHEITVRDGWIVRVKVYRDRAKALEAAGLPPESASQ